MTTSEAIFTWLEENKGWFKAKAICQKVGIDKGNFSRYKRFDNIPEKYLIPIMEIIMPLGFTLDKCITENNLPENKEKIEAERNEPNNASQITQYEEELKHLGTSSIANQRRKWLQNKLLELKYNQPPL